MKVDGGNRLIRKLRELPKAQREHVAKAIERNTRQGVRVAKVLAPVKSGKTKSLIEARFADEGMTGIVEVVDPAAPRPLKDRQYSIEHGRKGGEHGTTEGAHFVRTTRQYLGKKHKASIARAVKKAAKEVAGNG